MGSSQGKPNATWQRNAGAIKSSVAQVDLFQILVELRSERNDGRHCDLRHGCAHICGTQRRVSRHDADASMGPRGRQCGPIGSAEIRRGFVQPWEPGGRIIKLTRPVRWPMPRISLAVRRVLVACLLVGLSAGPAYRGVGRADVPSRAFRTSDATAACCCGMKDARCCGGACCQRPLPPGDRSPKPRPSDQRCRLLGIVAEAAESPPAPATRGCDGQPDVAGAGRSTLVRLKVRLNI